MASKALKHLSRKPIRSNDLLNRMKSLGRLPDQASALVCVALVERYLERAILSRMSPLTPTERSELFLGMSPLSTLSAKIRIAYALGIIGPNGRDDLNILKDVRNQFAHAFHDLTYDVAAIAAACQKLHAPDSAFFVGNNPDRTVPRYRFIITAITISTALSGKAIRGPRPKKSRDSFSLGFLR